MRTTYLFLLLFFLVTVSSAQDVSNRLHLGLISELAYFKTQAESLVRLVSVEEGVKEDQLSAIYKQYVQLHSLVDQFNLQLAVDLQAKNKLRRYGDIDKLLKGQSLDAIQVENVDDAIQDYVSGLKKIDSSFENLKKLSEDEVKGFIADNGIGQVTGAFSAVVGAIKTFSELKEKKVDKVVASLEATRLSPISELIIKESETTTKNGSATSK